MVMNRMQQVMENSPLNNGNGNVKLDQSSHESSSYLANCNC